MLRRFATRGTLLAAPMDRFAATDGRPPARGGTLRGMTSERRITFYVGAVFWTWFALLNGTTAYFFMREHHHSLPRLLAFNLMVWWAWVVAAPLVSVLARRLPLVPFRLSTAAIHTLLALAFSVGHGYLWLALTVAMKPYDAMGIRSIHEAEGAILGRMPFEFMIYCATVGVVYAADYYARFRERELRAVQLEGSLAQARLHALELQMQPHFLFNTLHSISALVRGGQNAAAVDMIAGLSDLLRYTLDHEGKQLVPLDRELAMLDCYLDLQQRRFSDRLTVRIDADDEVRRAAVPTLILQPLAENAIRHGIAQSSAAGRLEIDVARDGGTLRIDMFNTGSLADRPGRGIGLRNASERLRHLYGGIDMAQLEVRAARGGVLATLRVPWRELA